MIRYSNDAVPKLTVVIPTYEKHHKFLQEAVDSIRFEKAEVIIVNDSLEHLSVEGANITVINRDTPENWGSGRARNIGAKAANTDLLLWLDSDDMFLPNGVAILHQVWESTISVDHPEGKIVYGGLLRSFDNAYWPMSEQYCGNDINKSGLKLPAMPYCMLIPKAMHELINGYDEELITWEDVDYEKKITVAGLCAQHVNSAIFWYRWESGERRDLSDQPEIKQQVSRQMYTKYKKYHEGVEKLGNCHTCGNPPPSPYKANKKVGNLPEPSSIASNERLYLVYIGTDAVHTVPAPATRLTYRWGKSSRQNHYKKLVVDKTLNLTEGEVNRLDAAEFIQLRRRGSSYEFRYEVEVVVGEEPIPLKKKPVVVPVIDDKNPDVNFLFETKETLITDLTIAQLDEELASGDVFKSQLQVWREQEARQEKPRKGVIQRLDDAISSV